MRDRAFDDAFLDTFGADSVSGVDALSFSALTPPGDKLDDREGGLDSFGEVEALGLSFLGTTPLPVDASSIFTAASASAAQSPSSIF